MSTDDIIAARTALGIEFGSTRIKAVLIGPDHGPLATGSHSWENALVDGVWTYDLAEVWAGAQACVADLFADVRRRHGVELTRVGALGVSAMMHGYLATDADDELLVPFRTWRNTMTGQAAELLTAELGHNIPQRWSSAHLFQAILNGEEHVARVAHLNTLAGYVHHRLTGRRVLGVGDAVGMFPIDPATHTWDAARLARFDELAAERGFTTPLVDLLPEVLVAGQRAGELTAEGARLLDPTGQLEAGVPLCPPEGDAGTGMVATNAVAPRTGNVSAGTSIFAMVVLEGPLKAVHPELDIVTTPAGDPVAMVHCNNGTSDLNAWVGLFGEFAELIGAELPADELFGRLYRHAMAADADGGGLTAYNSLSGEHLLGLEQGRPLLVRDTGARFTLANLMRTHLMAVYATLREGMDILTRDEGVRIDRLLGHGGLFRTPGVAQPLLAAAVGVPVSVGDNAGEGGAWGIALLADFVVRGRGPLSDHLAAQVFTDAATTDVAPDPTDQAGFDAFMERHRRGRAVERAAVDHL